MKGKTEISIEEAKKESFQYVVETAKLTGQLARLKPKMDDMTIENV